MDIGNLPLGLAAIEKAKAIGAKTQRERDFINAMVAFYTELGRERKYAPFLARTRRRRAAKDGVGCRLLTRNGHDWTKRPGRGERAARARLALPGSRLEAIIDSSARRPRRLPCPPGQGRNLERDMREGIATKVEISDHWTDTGRKLFLAEVTVTTDHLRNFPRLMIEVPDQGNVEANVQEARRSLQRFSREIEKALQSPLRLARDRAPR